jgi:uncharacterized protein (TIGR00255 family)
MIKSMTAYGRAQSSSSMGKWVVEIHSVNKKGLDFHIYMSKDFLQFDLEVRKLLSAYISRGQVSVRIFFQSETGVQSLGRLRGLKKEMEKMSLDLQLPIEQITLPFLYEESKHLPVDLEGQEDLILSDLKAVLGEALHSFMHMRKKEGESLVTAFEQHLNIITSLLEESESKLLGMEDRYRKKILDKLEGYKEVLSEDRDRILREVFFFVEKSDVTEEVVRLKSHIQQFKSLLQSDEKGVGKAMDFLVQEMGREINTFSSKSDDLTVSTCALKMKSELEKIREQAQNVE